MQKIRRSHDRLILFMGIPVPEKKTVYILRRGPGPVSLIRSITKTDTKQMYFLLYLYVVMCLRVLQHSILSAHSEGYPFSLGTLDILPIISFEHNPIEISTFPITVLDFHCWVSDVAVVLLYSAS